jgi:hypothetical protein
VAIDHVPKPIDKEPEMADDKTKSGKPDRTRINVNEEYELRAWAERFAVSPGRLKEIVAKVGPMVDDVKAEFEKNHRPRQPR